MLLAKGRHGIRLIKRSKAYEKARLSAPDSVVFGDYVSKVGLLAPSS
jgi:hypothetical protein